MPYIAQVKTNKLINIMKKTLAILALALFIGGISVPAIAASNNAPTLISLQEDDPKKKSKSKKEKPPVTNEAPEEKEPTVMEIALKEAMEKADAGQPTEEARSKKMKNVSKEQDDILSRTLKHRV